MKISEVLASDGSCTAYAIHFLAAADAWGDAEIISAEQRGVIVEVAALYTPEAMIEIDTRNRLPRPVIAFLRRSTI